MRARFLLLPLALAAGVLPAAAAELLPAVARAPALEAAHRRIEAARARTESAGRLANPEIEAMGSRANMIDDNRNMWEVNVRQPLPKRGERAADRDRAQAGVAMAQADYAAMAGEIAADVAMALAEAEGAEARVRLLETQLGRLAAVLQSVEARLASGTTRLADHLIVQSRMAALQLMLGQERRMAADAQAEARGRLGLAPDAPLPGFAAPAPAEISADDAAALHLAAARQAEAGAMAKMAQASANPMTSVGLRLERGQTRLGNEDTIGLAFMSEIPWRSRGYARADLRAAEADRAAARADGNAARFRIASALTRVERADRLAATARRLAGETRARLTAEYDSLVTTTAASRGGESTVLQTVDILDKTTEIEAQLIQADTAARTARAELWRYVPASRLLTGTSSTSTP